MMNYLWSYTGSGKKQSSNTDSLGASSDAAEETPEIPAEDGLDFLGKKYEAELRELRAAVGDVLGPEHDDAWLLRFLVGTTLEKGKTRVRAMVEWRKEKKIHEIEAKIRAGLKPADFPHCKKIVRYFPQNIHHGFTRDGRPVSYELYGQADFQGLMSHVTQEEFTEFSYYKVEYMRVLLERLTKETGRLMRCCVVADLAALGYRHANLPFITMLKEVSKFPEEHYREQVGKVLVVNTNMMFSIVWRLVRPVLNKRTVQKISITYGQASRAAVEEVMPYDNLPEEIGGKATNIFDKTLMEALRSSSSGAAEEEQSAEKMAELLGVEAVSPVMKPEGGQSAAEGGQ